MKTGNQLVEQVNNDGTIYLDYDQSLSEKEIFDSLSKYFGKLERHDEGPVFYVGQFQGKSFAIRCKNVTYLGIPHPVFKKRIQIADDLQKYYSLAVSLGAEPLLMGIYSNHKTLAFVDFKIDTYLQKKANNSSAHIYAGDLSIAISEGFFEKTDYFGNQVTAFSPQYTEVFLKEKLGYRDKSDASELDADFAKRVFSKGTQVHDFATTRNAETQVSVNESAETKDLSGRFKGYTELFKRDVLPSVDRFFAEENRQWNGIECYKKMIEADYRNKFQPEWVGFFLEYEFEEYIKGNGLEDTVQYYQDKSDGGIDLDLYFPSVDCFGDLKAHSYNSSGIQGNDWDTVTNILKAPEKNHIYYIVCEHLTDKDSDHGYEVTAFWNRAQKKANLMSYAKRMKNNVTLTSAYILDLNKDNMKYLTKFRQGINSDGKPRKPKISIEMKDIDHFLLEKIDL